MFDDPVSKYWNKDQCPEIVSHIYWRQCVHSLLKTISFFLIWPKGMYFVPDLAGISSLINEDYFLWYFKNRGNNCKIIEKPCMYHMVILHELPFLEKKYALELQLSYLLINLWRFMYKFLSLWYVYKGTKIDMKNIWDLNYRSIINPTLLFVYSPDMLIIGVTCGCVLLVIILIVAIIIISWRRSKR